MHDARVRAASVTAALHDVAGLGGFLTLRVGGRDEGRQPFARFYAAGPTDLAEAVHLSSGSRRSAAGSAQSRSLPTSRRRQPDVSVTSVAMTRASPG